LVENDTKESLNEIPDLREALDAQADQEDVGDGRLSADDRENGAAERELERRLGPRGHRGWDR
jgi:hypothetical protein